MDDSRRTFVLGAAAVAGLSLKGGGMATGDRFGFCGKITAKEGQRDALVELLLEGARVLVPDTGCEMYIVNTMPDEPDAIWVNEIWRTEADHDASLKLEGVRAVISRARPLIAGMAPGIRLKPVGGRGLTVGGG